MKSIRSIYSLIAVVVFTLATSSFAHAQATRTWVSGVGDDLNPCSRTAPCKTFAGAISKTFIHGEIDALDPGGFGAITITKSITLDGTGTMASILASGTTGVIVNLTSSLTDDPIRIVRLRNLSINGTGSSGTVGTRTGLRGINVSSSNTSQPKVVVDDTLIEGFVNEGILFAANGGNLSVNNTYIRNNGTAGIGADSSANTVFVSVRNSYSLLNAQEGIRFEDNVRGTVSNSSFSLNTLNGVAMVATTGASELNIDLSQISNNKQFGVVSAGSLGTIRLTGNEITNNVTNGISITSGSVCSNTRNHITTPTQAPNCAFNDQ
jgi:hypothetical protein